MRETYGPCLQRVTIRHRTLCADGCSPETGRRLATRSACVEAMLVILTSKENDHAGQRNRGRTKARRLEQGQTDRAKPPLRPKHVWSIRTKLQIADRKRDLAMFNLAIDSKLRGCDVVA